jgi:hypothetical protein
MKLNRLETHDRYEYFIKDQSRIIFEGADDCLKRNPDSLKIQEKCHYVYLYAHPRTHDDGVTKRMLWQPRLLKPKAEINSYLFRATSGTDLIEICWLLPPIETWNQFFEENLCSSQDVWWSINEYKNNRDKLQQPFHDDLTEEQAKNVMIAILQEGINEKNKGIIV